MVVIAGIMPKNFRGQDYNSIKKECLKKGQLFEDPEFPANNKSLFYSKVDPGIDWMRPKVRGGHTQKGRERGRERGGERE